MRHLPSIAVVFLAGFTCFALAPAAQAGTRTLFPDLRGEDFPRAPNEVRFDWSEASRGALVGQGFHTRAGDVVFPSAVTAAVSLDPRTGAEVLRVTRLDDDCVAFAAAVGLRPEEGCLTVTATTIDRGVERLELRAPFFDYQVGVYLVQSREDAAEWNLAPSGRKGEPQVLRLRTRDAGEALLADWELSYRDDRAAVSLPLHATLPADAIRVAGFSTVHAALASAPELLYDLADFLVWEVLREEQITDDLPPSPGEEDDHCQVLTDCPAEYQSCTPTPGGWLACDGMGGGLHGGGDWGGGGVICPPTGCGLPPFETLFPDWQVGSASTTPPAKLPLFSGLTETALGYRLNYEITSVLQEDDTFSKPGLGSGYAAHVVYVGLRPEGSSQVLDCDDLRLIVETASFFVPQGSTRKYKGSGGTSHCARPAAGMYELLYALDPQDQWYEQDGEGNNTGTMRGKLLIRK